jgi:hypothetical protein
MLEKNIEKVVCEYARSRFGAKTYKFVSPQRRSVPDRIVVFPGGRLIFIEFKAPGKRPTPMQTREIEQLQLLGQSVFIIDDVDAGKRVIESVAWKSGSPPCLD